MSGYSGVAALRSSETKSPPRVFVKETWARSKSICTRWTGSCGSVPARLTRTIAPSGVAAWCDAWAAARGKARSRPGPAVGPAMTSTSCYSRVVLPPRSQCSGRPCRVRRQGHRHRKSMTTRRPCALGRRESQLARSNGGINPGNRHAPSSLPRYAGRPGFQAGSQGRPSGCLDGQLIWCVYGPSGRCQPVSGNSQCD